MSSWILFISQPNGQLATHVKKWQAAWLNISTAYRCVTVSDYLAADKQLQQQVFQAVILEDTWIAAQPKVAMEWVNAHAQLPLVILGQERLGARAWMMDLNGQDVILKQEVSSALLRDVLQQAIVRKKVELQLCEIQDELAIKGVQLETLAYTDHLTHIGNRLFFYNTVEPLLEAAQHTKKKYALLYLDVCNFKQINDCYGYRMGDEVLMTLANRIKQNTLHQDVIARLGGDEFVVLTEFDGVQRQAQTLAETLLTAIKEPIYLAGHGLHVEARLGVATFPESTHVEYLLRCAEMALAESKTQLPQVSFYTKNMEEKHQQRLMIESHLAQAFKQQEFYVVYQPIFSLETKKISGIEALLRWDSYSLRNISPEEFFTVVDDLEINQRICEFVTRRAGQAFSDLRQQGIELRTVSINITARQLLWEDFAQYFLSCLQEIELSPEHVMLELTERQAINHFQACKAQLYRLKAQGVRIALDDYGTGFSSITHLKQLPIDVIKLDQSLISHADQDVQRNQALSAGIIKMAHHLGLQVVAEGVETQAEYDSLCHIGCDYLQGYFLGRPVVVEDLIRSLQSIPSSNKVRVLRPAAARSTSVRKVS